MKEVQICTDAFCGILSVVRGRRHELSHKEFDRTRFEGVVEILGPTISRFP